MNHTPGPWTVSEDNWSQTTGDTYSILEESYEASERKANARLIAAAPELLEALKGVLVRLEHSGSWEGEDEKTAARAAIAKAEGVDPETAPVSADHTSAEAKS